MDGMRFGWLIETLPACHGIQSRASVGRSASFENISAQNPHLDHLDISWHPVFPSLDISTDLSRCKRNGGSGSTRKSLKTSLSPPRMQFHPWNLPTTKMRTLCDAADCVISPNCKSQKLLDHLLWTFTYHHPRLNMIYNCYCQFNCQNLSIWI